MHQMFQTILKQQDNNVQHVFVHVSLHPRGAVWSVAPLRGGWHAAAASAHHASLHLSLDWVLSLSLLCMCGWQLKSCSREGLKQQRVKGGRVCRASSSAVLFLHYNQLQMWLSFSLLLTLPLKVTRGWIDSKSNYGDCFSSQWWALV